MSKVRNMPIFYTKHTRNVGMMFLLPTSIGHHNTMTLGASGSNFVNSH